MKSTGDRDVAKGRKASQGKVTSPNRVRRTSKAVAPRPAMAKGFLPPLRTASAQTDGVTSGAAAMGSPSQASGTCVSSQFTPHMSGPTAGPVYEQVKYILLAEPQKNEQQPQGGETMQLTSDNPSPSFSPMGGTALHVTGGEVLADVGDNNSHRLFDAMWVTGTTAVDTDTTRAVGRPTYYVSSVVDMSKDHVLMPEEVMQMIVESRSSSDDGVVPSEDFGI